MLQNLGNIFGCDASEGAFSRLFLPGIRKQGIEGFKRYIDLGEPFCPDAVDPAGWTEAMLISQNWGEEGLRLFVENGGAFGAKRCRDGWTEAMHIAASAGIDGFRLFVENGGRFQPDAMDRNGYTEATHIAYHLGMEGLKLFVQGGGQVNRRNSVEVGAVLKALEKAKQEAESWSRQLTQSAQGQEGTAGVCTASEDKVPPTIRERRVSVL